MESTETITINLSAPEKRDNIYNLAKEIASYPQNHDELEILIADRIKKFVHGEKLSVYSRLLEYANYEKELSGQMKWFVESCLEPKVETHRDLYKKWQYGTDYSVRDIMVDHLEILKGVYEETKGGYYLAGSLDAYGYVYNFDGYKKITDLSKDQPLKQYTPEEKYWWCKCYLKYKTKDHHYYQVSADYIDEYAKEYL